MSELEGAPILCRRCGGASEMAPDASLRCRFCGNVDRLPPDELGRALEIRGRLVLAAARVAQVTGTERALAGIFEGSGAFFTLMGPWPILALLVTANAAWGIHQSLSTLPAIVPDETRVDLVVAGLYGPIFVIGLALSFPIALLVGRRTYRRGVRSKLMARPPLAPGAPMRCRACGAGLPSARDAFVTCRYCRTQNLLAPEIARDLQRRLDDEIVEYKNRANGVWTATAASSSHMTRTLFASFALVYVGVIAFGMVGRFVFGAMGATLFH
jgi:hypothetical protein